MAIRRSALRWSASAESSHPSGSYAEAADTLVRSIDIGEVCCAQRGHQVLEELRDLALLDHEVVERVQLGLVRQAELVEQVHDLLVGGASGQVVDVVAHVPQAARLPVDVGQPGLGCHDLAKASVAHRTLHRFGMVAPPIIPSQSPA